MMTGFRRVLKAGFVGFWRNAYVSIASIFVLTVALFVIGATMFLDQLLTTSLQTLQSKVDINVYFVPEAPQEEIDKLLSAVRALPEVEFAALTSREDALKEYRERNANDEIALQALAELNDNPLGATIAIQAKETSQYEGIAQFLDEQRALEQPQVPVIDEVNFNKNKDSIDKLTSVIEAVERGSLIALVILLVAAILITFNTIRLAIYTAREEIAIMRLVGASNMFIRGPFMLQGFMYGFIAGLLTLLIFYPILLVWGPGAAEFFEVNLLTYFLENLGYIALVLIGIGVVLGLVSSTLAVTRYLRT